MGWIKTSKNFEVMGARAGASKYGFGRYWRNLRIFGGNGRDRLLGEDGLDTLNGGSGKDTLIVKLNPPISWS